jgi:hypothetical protein
VLFSKYYYDDKIKESAMGGACSAHGRDEKCVQKFWFESLKGRDNSEDLVVDGRIILKWILWK